MKRLGNNAVGGNQINGAIVGTNSNIEVSEITIKLDKSLAWALCNAISKGSLNLLKGRLEKDQIEALEHLGEAIAAPIDHNNRNFEHLKTAKELT